MHILHVVSSVNPAFGGVSEFVVTLLRNPPPGDTAELVILDAPDSPWLIDLPFRAHALGPVATTYGRTPKLRRWLRENVARFDGVVVHGLWQYCGLAVSKEAHVKPYLVFPHGMLDPYFHKISFFKHAKKWVYWLPVEYWVLRGAHRVVFTSTEESRLALQSFRLQRWNSAVIPFGTLAPPPDEATQREAFLNLQPRLRSTRFILFLGRIHYKKGCDMLIEAFARIASTDPALHLVIAGPLDSNLSLDLREIAEDRGIAARVHWTGMLSCDAKWGAFRSAEAFILPSHQENFGIAVAEALACGRPVLLSDKINIAHEIASDGAGFVEPDTVEGTECLLRRWVATPSEERAAISARALACFSNRYDMRETAGAIRKLFEQAPS
jgi:glycosyltransferase involved in cell wall biosynthesis